MPKQLSEPLLDGDNNNSNEGTRLVGDCLIGCRVYLDTLLCIKASHPRSIHSWKGVSTKSRAPIIECVCVSLLTGALYGYNTVRKSWSHADTAIAPWKSWHVRRASSRVCLRNSSIAAPKGQSSRYSSPVNHFWMSSKCSRWTRKLSFDVQVWRN